MICDNCNDNKPLLVRVLHDLDDRKTRSYSTHWGKYWWCPRCVNGVNIPNGDKEAARITMAAQTKKIKHLEKMLGRCKS